MISFREAIEILSDGQPRFFISSAAYGTANGTLTPQSQALFIHNLSLPKVSSRSAARAAVHLLSGYKVMPAQCPRSSTICTVCSSA